ncbi:hypothetical protein P7C70_g9568, partial [Phenoliferia sp. Uapishka_3]
MLSADLVDQIYERRDRREQVREEQRKFGRETTEEDELTVRQIMTEVRFIFVGRAKRGKASQLRGRHNFDSSESDSGSASGASSGSDGPWSIEEEEERTHQSKSRRQWDADSKSGRHQQKLTEEKGESGASDGVSEISDLLIGFRELQAGLSKFLSKGSNEACAPAAAGTSLKPQRNSKRKEERNERKEEEEGSVSMSISEGSNIFTYGSGCMLLETQPPEESHFRKVSDTQDDDKRLSALSMKEGENMRTHRTSNGGWCFWCNGEDGRHRLARCEDLNQALKSREVWKDQLGKLRWKKLYIPAQSHSRGMRGWVRDKEALEKVGIRMISNRRATATDWRERDPKSLRSVPEKPVPHSGARNTKLPMLHKVS